MTIRTKDEMYNEIDTKIPDNSIGSVTPALTRSVMKDMFDTSKWRSFTSLSANTTLDQGVHNGVIADDSAGSLIFTLPDNAANSGASFGVLKASSSTNTITINPTGSDTINGDNTLVFDTFGEFVSVMSDGAGQWYIVNRNLPTFETIELDTTGTELPTYKAGQLAYDPNSLTNTSDTGITGVRVQIGQELHWLVYNDSGAQINNGKPCYASGVNATEKLVTIGLADASSFFTSAQVVGFATHNIPNGTVGLVSEFGQVRDFDTSLLNEGGVIYLGLTPGAVDNTKPGFPNQAIVLGTCVYSHATEGVIQVRVKTITREVATKSESFSSATSGEYWLNGFYDNPTTDANLTQAATTTTWGTATTSYQAHAFGVFSGAGSVDTGVVGLRCTGTTSGEDGSLVPVDSEILSADITTLSTNQYIETSKKFVGTVTYELYIVSGSPTAYSLDFNYGYAKYDDFWNTDFTMYGIEVIGEAGANDTGFDIHLMHHKNTGWTYASTGFVAGNGIIADYSTDLGSFSDLTNGDPITWKRTGLNTFIDGNGSEGFLFKVATSSNNSVRRLTAHVAAFYE
jgi:hypothetical protein